MTADAHTSTHTASRTDYQYDTSGTMTNDPTDGVTSTFDTERFTTVITEVGIYQPNPGHDRRGVSPLSTRGSLQD
ncbi:MAG TPA: hypothetical protein VKZ53_19200 [Candidatus Angelobacter sp.]|nr:hypothetical protein [Candidatus Angelobacter sp.]